jgi:glucosamine kinase
MPPPPAGPTPGPPAGPAPGAVPLVLGLDMGGTATRAVLADLSGTRYGTGRAGPGNPIAHGVHPAAQALHDAVRQALTTGRTEAAGEGTGEVDPGRVRLGLAGMAGGSVWADPAVRAVFERAWHDAGPSCPLDVVGDPDVAFAGATPAPDGTALIAGTGAAAGRIHEHRLARFTGGHGWLLGDEGGGFWLGREAIRALLSVLDTGTPPGLLTNLTLAELSIARNDPTTSDSIENDRAVGGRVTPEMVIEAVARESPVRVARFAPLVSRAAEEGDPVALGLVVRAADHLCELIARVHLEEGQPAGGGPVVLAGSVVGAGTPVDAAVRRRLAELGIGPVLAAGDGAAGAAWLAIRAVRGAASGDRQPSDDWRSSGGRQPSDELVDAWGRVIG